MRPKIERYFLESFFLERNFWSSILLVQLCSHQCLWSGFIFPELEHLYKNVFTASFPKRSVRNLRCSFVSKKRTRSGSNVSSRVGKDQLSIHFTRLLDDLKSRKNYCPRKLFSGSNSSPEKSSPENIARFLSRKSVLRPASGCFHWIFFFPGLVLADRSPPSPRAEFHSPSSLLLC